MEAPDKIFCWRGVLGTLFCSLKKGTNTDCTEYIRKDLLLEWAKKELEMRRNTGDDYFQSAIAALRGLIDKLNSL